MTRPTVTRQLKIRAINQIRANHGEQPPRGSLGAPALGVPTVAELWVCKTGHVFEFLESLDPHLPANALRESGNAPCSPIRTAAVSSLCR